jgi:hypothetical protein
LVRLDANVAGGSAILLQADQITLDGQTVFINSLKSEGFVTDDDLPTTFGNITISAPNAPTARPDTTPLQPGDRWLDTDNGDLPHVWANVPPEWVREYTVIDGGNITTGTIDAQIVTVINLNADNITTGTLNANRLNITAIIEDNDLATEGFVGDQVTPVADNAVRVFRQTTAPTASDRTNATIRSGDIWYKTNEGDLPHTYDGTTPFNVNGWIRAYTVIDGGNITTGTLNANRIEAGTITATEIASATITGDKLVAGTITATQIDVTNLFAQQIQITSTGYIQSGNYSTGATGFRINADGNAEFRQVTVDGVLIAKADSNIDWQYVTSVSVSTAQIGDAQITTAKIDDLQVTNAKIGALAVTDAKIADLAVTNAKIDDLAVTTAKIGDAQITNAKINDLDAVKINAGFLNAARIEAGSLNADKITAGTITATQLATDSVTADKIDVTNLQAISANMGTLNVDGVLTFSDTGSIISSKARPGGGDFVTVINNNGYNLTEEITASNVRGIDLGIGGILVTKTVSAVTTQVFIEPEGITSPSVQSAYKSADGTAGLTETIVFNDSVTNETNTVTIKNGLITAWTQIV